MRIKNTLSYLIIFVCMNNRFLFFLLSFLEGASVMTAELLGAKMLTPYFGSSLYVWASVLGITLGGLAVGYFSGGIVSTKKNPERNLYIILLASAIFLIVMPLLARLVMIRTAGLDLIPSVIISALTFLFPPVFFMGMVSPVLVRCISHEEEYSGKAAGIVFAISTTGGIIATFALGFWVIPEYGLTMPAILAGITLGSIPFFKLIFSKRFFALVFPVTALFSLNSSSVPVSDSDIKVHYSSEGLLGQILIADYPVYTDMGISSAFQRMLFVNRSTQTIVTYKGKEREYFEYVNIIAREAEVSSGKNVLILGLGGGSLANILTQKGFSADAVELDARMVYVARKFFHLGENVNVFIDDARHFIRNQNPKKKYNIIILDAFIGEVNPHHLFTQEFFSEIKLVLADSGIFYINCNGYWDGEIGKGTRSVCKTLITSGFDVAVIPTSDDENYRNIILKATISSSVNGKIYSKQISNINLRDAVILEDEKPCLEILNSHANKKWREQCMRYFLNGYYSKRDVILFK